MKIKIIFKLILTIFFINLGSCGLKITDNHGQIFDSNLTTDLFKEGKTTKEEITNILGTPSIKSTFDGEKSWFYVSSEFEKFIFLDFFCDQICICTNLRNHLDLEHLPYPHDDSEPPTRT